MVLAMSPAIVVVLVGAGIFALLVVFTLATEGRRREAREAAMRRKAAQGRARRNALLEKYDEATAERILRGEVWQGQTAEQLADSMGSPVDVDQKVLKTKTKEVWKYGHRGGNRYAVKIMLENGYVVGWDEKI
jgi:hypothetical protein